MPESTLSTDPRRRGGDGSAQARAPQGGLLRWVGGLGRACLAIVGGVGRPAVFLGRAVACTGRPPFRGRLIVEQLHFIGNRSLGIVALTSAFTGLVLTLQGYYALSRFGAEGMVGSLVALSLVRELAPVLGALMVTARAGSAMAATIGNMRVTEQIDALKTMAIDPMGYLVAPRLVASLLAGPMLVAMFILTGLGVSRWFAVRVLRLDGGAFTHSISSSIETADVAEGLTKAVVFSLVMVWIATYRGYQATGGAQGVGQATTRAVVETSVLVLALDYLLTALLF